VGTALVLRALRCGCAKLLEPARELVAYTLEGAEVEQARALDEHTLQARRTRRREVGKGVRHDARKLVLESRDLPPQSHPRGPLSRLEAPSMLSLTRLGPGEVEHRLWDHAIS